MDTLSDLLPIVVQVLGLWLIVSVVTVVVLALYLVIGSAIYDRIHPPRDEKSFEKYFEDLEDYMTKQAKHEIFFQQIEEYRNDFS